jgi:hypothetical protein
VFLIIIGKFYSCPNQISMLKFQKIVATDKNWQGLVRRDAAATGFRLYSSDPSLHREDG